MENKEVIHIFRKIQKNSIEIKIKKKRYQIKYPKYIWDKFPKSLHKVFADSLTHISTWHIPLVNQASVVYHFPHPPIESVFFKMLFYSLPMNVFENKELKTSSLLKNFYNANFLTQFKSLNYFYSGKKVKKQLKNNAIILFSFGKDSLLTYGLLNELGVNTVLIFIKEPYSIFENHHKKKLAERFFKQFKKEVEFFPLSVGKLRQSEGLFWGWDIILSQYAFTLLPYFFYYQAKYLFFGNEQSCNFYVKDDEGYFVNPVFEQSVSGMQLLQNIPKLFFISTHIGSLVEPINEIFITYILHHRYSELGKYQMSCFSEETEAKKRRWCGVCEKCVRMYIFFKALGISPDKVGFYNNDMLSLKKENYYVIFNNKIESTYGGSGLGKDEQLLAFYLAYKRGAKGELIEKFKKIFLSEVEKRKERLIDEYFGIHSSYSLPSALRKRVLNIFETERKKVLKEIRRTINK
jgi:hypothetical protein